jgi:hypothetical protein
MHLPAAAQAAPAPATSPTAAVPSNPSQNHPAYWLRRGMREATAAPAAPADEVSDEADAASLLATTLAVGQGKIGDRQGLRESIRLRQQRLASRKDALRRTGDWLSIAAWHQMLAEPREQREAIDKAAQEAARITDPEVRMMMELQTTRLRESARAALPRPPGLVDRGEPRPPADAAQRVSFHCTLAAQARQAGDPAAYERHRRLAEDAADLAITARPALAERLRQRLADLYLRAGDFERAEHLSRSLPAGRARVGVYTFAARGRFEAGDKSGYMRCVDLASKEAAGIDDPVQRCGELLTIAAAQSQLNDMTGAKMTLESARAAADQVAQPTQRARALLGVAAGHARAQDPAAARASMTESLQARKVAAAAARPDESWVEFELARVGEALAESGAIADAQEIARQLKDPYLRSAVTRGLVAGLLREGRLSEALDHQRKLTEPQHQVAACRAIGERYGRLRQFDAMEKWLGGLTSPSQKSAACLGAAEGLLGRKVVDGRGAPFEAGA